MVTTTVLHRGPIVAVDCRCDSGPADEFVCTHDHVRGDVCLSFQLDPAVVDALGARTDAWESAGVPPLPELMVLGELAQAAAEDRSRPRRCSLHAPSS